MKRDVPPMISAGAGREPDLAQYLNKPMQGGLGIPPLRHVAAGNSSTPSPSPASSSLDQHKQGCTPALASRHPGHSLRMLGPAELRSRGGQLRQPTASARGLSRLHPVGAGDRSGAMTQALIPSRRRTRLRDASRGGPMRCTHPRLGRGRRGAFVGVRHAGLCDALSGLVDDRGAARRRKCFVDVRRPLVNWEAHRAAWGTCARAVALCSWRASRRSPIQSGQEALARQHRDRHDPLALGRHHR